MCISELHGKNVPIKLWTRQEEVEEQALGQLKNIAELPWVFKHVAVMPDVHYGKGATVGSVIAMKDAVSPAAVGVDIGCGMMASKTNLTSKDLPESLKQIRSQVERDIPVGFNAHDDEVFSKLFTKGPNAELASHLMGNFPYLSHTVQDLSQKMKTQIGTLGGGNHFIELCVDTEDNVWLLLHSGSRNIGKTLAEHHIAIARGLIHNETLPDKDLAVFLSGTSEMREYARDLAWAQQYAYLNRVTMMELYKNAIKRYIPHMETTFDVICHHNYVSEETHFGEDVIVTRKGAISARNGEYGIIPGSMGAKSFIVKGLGNPDSFHSASHGAGRRLSRNKAKAHFSVEDLEKQTHGVECRKDLGVLDEIPGAYKDIIQVMKYQESLVSIVAELKQVMCVKG